MPTYEYKCSACGAAVTRFVKMSERADQTCECGQKLVQQISAPQPPVFRGVKATCSMNTSQS